MDSLYGISAHAWCSEFFSSLTDHLGVYLYADNNSKKRRAMDVARILIRTKGVDPINEIFSVSINGLKFNIILAEDWFGSMQWKIISKGSEDVVEMEDSSNDMEEDWSENLPDSPLAGKEGEDGFGDENGGVNENFISDSKLKSSVINSFGEDLENNKEAREEGSTDNTFDSNVSKCNQAYSHVSVTRGTAHMNEVGFVFGLSDQALHSGPIVNDIRPGGSLSNFGPVVVVDVEQDEQAQYSLVCAQFSVQVGCVNVELPSTPTPIKKSQNPTLVNFQTQSLAEGRKLSRKRFLNAPVRASKQNLVHHDLVSISSWTEHNPNLMGLEQNNQRSHSSTEFLGYAVILQV